MVIWDQAHNTTVITDPGLSDNHIKSSKMQGMHHELRIQEMGFLVFG